MKAPATFAAAAVSFMALSLSALNANDGGVGAAVTLRDSSVIKGTVAPDTVFEGGIVFDSSAKRSFPMGCEIGGMALPVPAVGEMVANGTNGVQVVTLVNGDKFHFNLKAKALPVSTSLGDFSIPFSSIRRLAFIAKEEPPAGSLIFHCTFDSPESVEKPAVGPGGTLGNAWISKGKIGNAMYVPRYGSAGLFRFPEGFLKPSGCVEFWAKLDAQRERFSSCDPRFFVLRLPPRREFFVEFSSNNGAGKGGLHVRLFALGATSSNRMGGHVYTEILGEDPTGWHHYAVSWNEESTVPLVFIDGCPLRMEGSYPGRLDKGILAASTVVLSFPNDPAVDDGTQPQCAFLIDEFKIWNYCKTDFSLSD